MSVANYGNMNVLDILGGDLFDETQENPHLLTAISPSKPNSARKASMTSHASLELPLDDFDSPRASSLSPSPQFKSRSMQGSPVRTVPQGNYPVASNAALPFVPFQAGTQPLSMAWQAVESSPQRPSACAPVSPYPAAMAGNTTGDMMSAMKPVEGMQLNESELHKLLYSLSRFGLAPPSPSEDPSGASTAPSSPARTRYHPTDFHSAGYPSTSLWIPQAPPNCREYEAAPTIRSTRKGNKKKKKNTLSRATSSSRRSKKRMHQYNTEEDFGEMCPPPAPARAVASRGSVTFATVKNLLRGGGLISRTVRRPQMESRRKSMGTISSRLKRRQKFQRPTILTDADHRVSNMKLGQSPLKVKIKHLPFPTTWKEPDYSHEDDPAMRSPRQVMKRNSMIDLETLDKIGTRAACPVHLIEEPAPDYSKVRARVDSFNCLPKPKKTLRRPSAWLLGATPTQSPDYEDLCG